MAVASSTSRPTVARSLTSFLFVLGVLGVAGVLGVLGMLGHVPSASAKPQPDVPPLTDPPGLFTELSITGLADGQAVGGYVAPDDFDPLAGYPAGIPAGSTEDDASFAGTIMVEDTLTGRTGLTYCIDLLTETQVGVHYHMGPWSDAEIPHLGYIAYILHNYFPTTGQPAGATSDDQRAAAVQAAIWYFSDRYVLDTTSPVRPLTQAIVADALENGPTVEPSRPELTVTPNAMAAPATGEIVGPFEVTADGPSTIRSVGVEVFTDSAGTNQLQDGDEVAPNARLWVRTVSPDTPQGFVLERQVRTLVSTVYLYDGTNPGRDTAQKLVLAQEAQLTKRAGALITPFAAGALEVTKTIGGTGAGFQGDITIDVSCTAQGQAGQTFRRTLDARSAAGDRLFRLGGIRAGSTCVITETANGDNDFVNIRSVVIAPETVAIAENETARASVTNTYDRAFGALHVTKTIAGEGAGRQGTVVVMVACDNSEFDRKFRIAASMPAGDHPQAVIEDIPAGTRCTVTEPVTGENIAVQLREGAVVQPASAVVTDRVTTAITVQNTYTPRDLVPSGDGIRTLPATGISSPLQLATLAVPGALGAGLLILLRQRHRAGRRQATG